MANPWFRMYAEFATDAKVQMMSEAMQRRLLMVFCMRCSDVTVTLSDDEIAFHMRITPEELAETKALFVRKGFIDQSWNALNWEKRQSPSDSSAARTRTYRERKREKGVTSHVTECDVLEEKREEEKREEKSSASPETETGNPASAAPVASRSPTGSRLPADWQPDDVLRAWTAQNCPGLNISAEVEKFRDYWAAKAGKDGRKADWSATWRNWARRASEGFRTVPMAVGMDLVAGGGRKPL